MAVGNMLRVLKGNQETLISPANKDKYLQDGYSVIDEDGTVLEQGVKSWRKVRTDLDVAVKRLVETEQELLSAKKKISELEEELRGYKESDSAESESAAKKGRKAKEPNLSD